MPNNAREVFAQNLRELLDRTGRTQADLIRELGLRQSTVSDWMSGKKYPRVDKIQLLADFFGVNRSALTEGQPAQSLPGTTQWLRAGLVARGCPVNLQLFWKAWTFWLGLLWRKTDLK